MNSREEPDQEGPCGRCHTCGQKLKENRSGEEQCLSCGKVRKYLSHGWYKGESSPCPRGKALKKILAKVGGEDKTPAAVGTEEGKPSDVRPPPVPVELAGQTSGASRKRTRAKIVATKGPSKVPAEKATRKRAGARPEKKTAPEKAQRARKRGRYSEDQKRELLAKLQALRQDGLSLAAASENLGVTALSLAKWLKAGKGRGEAPKKPGRRPGRPSLPSTPASDVYVVMTADGYRLEGPLNEAFLRVLKGL